MLVEELRHSHTRSTYLVKPESDELSVQYIVEVEMETNIILKLARIGPSKNILELAVCA
jgi:hypothetical protein